MKTSFKKSLTVLLFILLVLSLLVSCQSGGGADSDKDKDGDDNNIQADIQNDGEDGDKQPEERVYPNLEAADFGGYEFLVLTRTVFGADWAEWDHRDIYAEELNSDVINDAVFNRNKKIEEKYNIEIKDRVLSDVPAVISRAVKVDDDVYDLVAPHNNEMPAMASAGNLVDLFKVPYLDLESPWWDRGTVRDLSIMHKLFMIQGDLLIIDNDAMEAMIFNKNLLQENELESPYDIVKRGEWTFEKLTEMSRNVSKDLNGDGQMYIKDDLFGLILQRDTSPSFIVSAGEKICAKDENDYPIITFGTERHYRIMEAITELMLDEENVVHLHRYEGQFGIYDEQVKMFQEDRALFSWIRMRIVERLRGMETDFGILPCPKLDASQENYYTRNNPHTGAGIAIPVTASDLARTGMILEDLCAESRYTLQPAYYEINLKGKYARDEDSREMLDIILQNTAHDIGDVYNFGEFGKGAISQNGQNRKADYVSDFEKAYDRIQRDIDKVIAAYEKLD